MRPTDEPPGEPRGVVALFSGERAGKISTRNAGAFRLDISLSWRPGDGLPAEEPLLDKPAPGAKFCSLTRTEDLAAATRRVTCEVRALYDEHLTGALDGAVRSVAAYAALTDAVLEWRAVRLACPAAPPAPLVEALARQLWAANLPVSFGPSWTPLPGDAGISVGARGREEKLRSFLQASAGYQTLFR